MSCCSIPGSCGGIASCESVQQNRASPAAFGSCCLWIPCRRVLPASRLLWQILRRHLWASAAAWMWQLSAQR